MSSLPLLSLLILTPWIGALVLAFMGKAGAKASRGVTLLFSLSTLALGLAALAGFDPAVTGPQFSESHTWIRALHVRYHLGLDGMSLLLVLLTGLVSPFAILSGWKNERDVHIFGALFLLLQGAALGVFVALDFFPWFLFWELSLVPAYFLIRLWGGPGGTAAAYQFVVYTIGGSAFMLLGFAALFAATGTMDFRELAALAADGRLARLLPGAAGTAVFVGVLLGLAVKVPLFPFHTWLPSAYAEAPAGVTMFLTGIMSKMGVYGFLRILWPIFPDHLHAAAPCLIWLALGGIVFGAWAAMRQTDLKRMMAYSSINHLGCCLFALFAVAYATGRDGLTAEAAGAALAGALLQMFNHGLSAAALFFALGIIEERSGGKRGIGDFGGIRTAAPVFAGLCGIALFSSLGLPGLNGFVGEFLIFRGAWGLHPVATAVATLGLLGTALFLLTFWQRVFHGPARGAGVAFAEVAGRERLVLGLLAALMLLFGVLPGLLTPLINPLVTSWAGHLTLP